MVSKRFREPEDTDEALKKMEVKKRRSAKKELKGHKSQAQSINMKYFINGLQSSQPSITSTSVIGDSNMDFDENLHMGKVEV